MVMCTHLHVDHVGWNTRLDNGRWVPTFPNARYVFSKTDYDHFSCTRSRSEDRAGEPWLVPRQRAAGGRGRARPDGRRRAAHRGASRDRAGAGPHARTCRHQARLAGRAGVLLRRRRSITRIQVYHPEWNSFACLDAGGGAAVAAQAAGRLRRLRRAAGAGAFRRAAHLSHRREGRWLHRRALRDLRRLHVLRPDAEAEQPRRNAPQQRKACHQPDRQRRLQFAARLQGAADDVVLQQRPGSAGSRASGIRAASARAQDRHRSTLPRRSGSHRMFAAATASCTARFTPTPPIGDIACAASPMHSSPGRASVAQPVDRDGQQLDLVPVLRCSPTRSANIGTLAASPARNASSPARRTSSIVPFGIT